MIIASNEEDILVLQDGKDGISADSKYTWVKYSKNEDGSEITDDPTNAVYIGISYNQTEPMESTDPSDYTWIKIHGEDGYSVILENENVSFSVNSNNTPIVDQIKSCKIVAFKGIIPIADFSFGVITAPNGITTTVSNSTVYMSVSETEEILEEYGSIQIPIIIDGITFNKAISFNLIKETVSVIGTDFIYYSSTSSSELLDGEWETDRPVWQDGKYIWSKTVTTYSDGTTSETEPICVTGFQGVTGKDGTSVYLYVKYSDDGKTFSGNMVANLTVDDWENGMYSNQNGEKISYTNRIRMKELIPVLPLTSYVFETHHNHIRFILRTYDLDGNFLNSIGNISNSKIITTAENEYFYSISAHTSATDYDLSVENFELIISEGFCPDIREEDETGDTIGKWMGTYVGESANVPIDFNLYTWNKVVGENGNDGIPGKDGADGKTTYFHVKYSSVENPTESSQISETPAEYIGTYVDYTEEDSNDPSLYTWVKFMGTDGKDGIPGKNGADGTSQYLHIKYSDDGKTFSGNIVSANIEDWEDGQYHVTNGEKTDNSTRIRFNDLSPITPSTEYIFSSNLTGVGFAVRSYDKNKVFLRSIGAITNNKTITSAEDEYFYGISIYSDIYEVNIANFEYLVSLGFCPDVRSENELGKTQGSWIGVCVDENESDSIDFNSYSWQKINGNDGMGIRSITEQYYLSSSKDEIIDGEWTTEMPVWEDGKYIWTRLEINYENPDSTVYTIPVCDSSWEALEKVNSDLIEAKSSIEKAQIDIDNIKKEIELSVVGDTVTSAISTMKSDIKNATEGINKWLIEIYPKSILDENYRENIDFLAFYGTNVNPSIKETIDDSSLSTSFDYGNDYVGYGLTFVQVGEDISTDITFNKLVKGSLFLNGVCKNSDTASLNETITLDFKQGWNVLEVIWNVDTNVISGGFAFNENISENENCILMNCYYRTITGRESFMQTQTASINIGLSNITSTVSNIESTLGDKADSDTVNELIEQVTTVTQTFDDYRIQVSETYATLEGLKEINSAVIDIQNNMITNVITSNEFTSIIEQTKDYWRTEFERDGAICGSTTISSDGILVEGADESVGIIVRGTTDGLYESRMTPLEFSGWYNGEKVFYLNEDETVTERLYVTNGISLNYIKIMPIDQDSILGIDFLGTTANLYS